MHRTKLTSLVSFANVVSSPFADMEIDRGTDGTGYESKAINELLLTQLLILLADGLLLECARRAARGERSR